MGVESASLDRLKGFRNQWIKLLGSPNTSLRQAMPPPTVRNSIKSYAMDHEIGFVKSELGIDDKKVFGPAIPYKGLDPYAGYN